MFDSLDPQILKV